MKPTTVLLCCLAATASALQLRPKTPPKAQLRAAAPKSAATRAPEVAALAAATTLLPLAAHAEVAGWVQPLSDVLDPALFFIQFIMLLRVIISWYPETDLNDMPWRIVTWPTEPVLKLTRAVVPPSFGVDVSPIVWIAVASFSRELLLGQQGVLILMMQRG